MTATLPLLRPVEQPAGDRILSLSTMWAQQEHFFADMHLFAEKALALGFDAIEVAHSTPEAPFERLRSYAGAPISSIHAPAPFVRDDTHGPNSSINLATLDDEARRVAVAYTKRSIDFAHEAGAGFVVLHLGGAGNKMFDAELQMRRLYDSGVHGGERMEELREECYRLRAEQREPWLERARATLRQLVDHAEPLGVALGLENRLHYHEFPQPDEAAWLVSDYPPEVAGYWHDVGHAEVQDRLGLVDKRLWLDTNGARCIGTHLHDVTGLADHRAPGNGDVDWSYIAAGIPRDALRVFEINQGQDADAVAAAIPYLRERGVI